MRRRIILLLAALLIVGPAQASRPKLPPDVHQALYDAQEALKAGKPSKARRILEDHLKSRPKAAHPMIYSLLGGAWHDMGDDGRALSAYEKGLALDPGSYPLHVNAGNAAYELERFAVAADHFLKASDLTTGDDGPDLRYQAAVAAYQGQDPGRSREILERLLKTRPSAPADWLRLYVHACLDLGEAGAATSRLESLLEQTPDAAEYWRLLARLRSENGDDPGAAAALEIAHALAAPSAQEAETLAALYQHLGFSFKALVLLETLWDPNPSPEQLDRLAELAAAASLTDRAAAFLDRRIAIQPDIDARVRKARYLIDAGRWNAARQSLDACLREAPNHALARLLMGHCAMETGDLNMAETALAGAVEDDVYGDQARAALHAVKQMKNIHAED